MDSVPDAEAVPTPPPTPPRRGPRTVRIPESGREGALGGRKVGAASPGQAGRPRSAVASSVFPAYIMEGKRRWVSRRN